MTSSMIRVQGIGKQYRIRERGGMDAHTGLSAKLRRLFSSRGEPFWALRDISFEVKQGQALGIIGRNGAGKSTLLKLLSRITTPTEGRFEINGRVSSLLEVGTGFHDELSGRENIFLNGTILGMRRAEVKQKFDEIVAFSGVERFLDNPVKHYSSGQKVRLAFAVAAHLEPEVLIIDEVLAVGDAEFQRKCLGKMKDVAKNGRTVLFVSHNMSAINSLCDRCILLDQGHVELEGDTSEVTRQYLSKDNEDVVGERDLSHIPLKYERGARLESARWVDTHGNTIQHTSVSSSFGLEITHRVFEEGHRAQPVVLLYNALGEQVFTTYPGVRTSMRPSPGVHVSTVLIPADLLNTGTYFVTLWLVTWLPYLAHQVLENIMRIDLLDDLASPTHPPSDRRLGGVIRPYLEWKISE
jgi:lipopolysaccharide transport system ATP-binding protein